MIEITIKVNNIGVTLKNPDADSVEECVELTQTAISWCYGQSVEIEMVEEEDDNIYIQTDPPEDHIQHEGM
tara:strand:- start:211 stop:423 length:213 start_codon:yes stop_codon:yes gene_type:complete